MALSEELKSIYSSNTVTQRVYDTVEMYHPLFTETFYLIADSLPKTLEVFNNDTQLWEQQVFQPFAFTITRPPKGSKQQDMQFIFSNVAQIGITQLELAAEDMSYPITLTFRLYIEGDLQPHNDPIVLELTNVSATSTTISGTASRTNLFGKKVPSRNFDSWIFKGVA